MAKYAEWSIATYRRKHRISIIGIFTVINKKCLGHCCKVFSQAYNAYPSVHNKIKHEISKNGILLLKNTSTAFILFIAFREEAIYLKENGKSCPQAAVDLVILEASLGIIEIFYYFTAFVIKYIQGISMTM